LVRKKERGKKGKPRPLQGPWKNWLFFCKKTKKELSQQRPENQTARGEQIGEGSRLGTIRKQAIGGGGGVPGGRN